MLIDLIRTSCRVEQWLACQGHILKVGGSNPPSAPNIGIEIYCHLFGTDTRFVCRTNQAAIEPASCLMAWDRLPPDVIDG